MPRYSLRTLLILLAVVPPVIAGGYWAGVAEIARRRNAGISRKAPLDIGFQYRGPKLSETQKAVIRMESRLARVEIERLSAEVQAMDPNDPIRIYAGRRLDKLTSEHLTRVVNYEEPAASRWLRSQLEGKAIVDLAAENQP